MNNRSQGHKVTRSQAIQVKTKIIANQEIAKGLYKLSVIAPQIARRAKPGQFLNIKVNDAYQPLLRKPLGINSVKAKKGQIDILYKVVGKGTQALSARKKGEVIDILGPLGNGFDIQSSAVSCQSSVLVGGGIGIAPLMFLAEELKKRKTQNAIRKTLILLGAKTKKELLCEKEFKDLGCDVRIATDDGSRGFKGTASELLKHLLSTIDYRLLTIYACGPKPMLKAVACLGKKFDLTCYGLLEEYMACGTGICFGCVVKTLNGYKRVCKEGPVFDLKTIEW